MEIKEILKKIPLADRLYFSYINLKYKLNLNFQSNKSQLAIFKEVFYHKVYKLGFPKGLENGIFVDIGAHYGYFSMFAAKNAGSGTKIFAAEPSGDNFSHLLNNIAVANLKSIIPAQFSISGSSIDRTFYTAKSSNHSLYENYHEHMMPSTLVQCLTLDGFMNLNNIDRIDFLKIDREGAEHEIFQNSDSSTLQKIHTISMEMHDMEHCGYSSDKTLESLTNARFEYLYSDYHKKKHKKGYNAKVVMRLKKIT